MSFSNDVKREICSNTTTEPSLLRSELYAMLLFSKEFSKDSIVFKTESRYTCDRFTFLLSTLFTSVLQIDLPSRNRKIYLVKVIDSFDAKRIFDFYGHDIREVSLRINRAFTETGEEIKAFLRGAFLSCGSVSDPEKMYHLEFSVSKKNLCLDLCRIINESGFNIKMIQRNGSYMAYIKDSERITDFLTFLGAVNGSLTMIGTKAYKDVRNNANRKANSEFANLEKQAKASAQQIKAINRLKKSGEFALLPEDLKRIAQIRIDNPGISLREIGEMLDPPLSRSGVNHRIEKIIRLAGEK